MALRSNVKKLSTTNTKQEMLDAYNKLVEQMDSNKDNEIKAAEKIEEKQTIFSLEVADSLTSESINKKISELKFEFNTGLNTLSEKIEEEYNKYTNVKKAVAAKEKELQEIFNIQKQAQTLYALIEAQKEKEEEFISEMEDKKLELETEIKEKRIIWEKEKVQKEIEIKEKEKQELALRNRDRDEYNYKFQREQQIAKDNFETMKANLEKEMNELRENTEKELAAREKNIVENEMELKELRQKTANFPKELNNAIDKAVKEATERIILDGKHKDELQKSTFDGEKKSMIIKIESLEKTIKEQNELIAKYSNQLEKSYNQIQDIATKAVEGSSGKIVQSIPSQMSV